MELLHLKIENFLSYAQAELDLANRGLVLVLGDNQDSTSARSNGSGKSSLFESIQWILYGSIPRGIRGADLIRFGQRKCKGSLRFHLQGATYDIVRSQSGSQSLKVFRNGDDISRATFRDTSSMLQEILQIPIETFGSVILLGQGFGSRYTGFGARGRSEVIESLVGLEVYDAAHGRAKELGTSLASRSSACCTRIETLMGGRKKLLAALEGLRVSHRDETQRLAGSRKALDDEILSLTGRIDTLQEQTESLKGSLSQVETRQTELTETWADLDRNWKSLNLSSEGLQKEIRKLQASRKAILSLSGECPTCKQAISDVHKSAVSEKLVEMIAPLEKELGDLTIEMESVHARCGEHKKSLAEMAPQVAELRGHVLNSQQEIARCQARRESLQEERDRTTDSLKSLEVSIAQMEEGIRTTDAEIMEHKALLARTDARAQEVSFWVTGFSPQGIRSYCLDSVLTWLSSRIDEYVGVLLDREICVRLRGEKELRSGEKRNAIEISLSRGTYESSSGGERRRLDLAIHFALQDLALSMTTMRPNILVADEILDALDEEASVRVCELLRRKADETGSVFLISHDPYLKSLIPTVLEVQKKGGISTLKG